MSNTSDSDSDSDYHVPLVDQRVFGAGIKRKRIAFIPASRNADLLPQPQQKTTKPVGIGDRYLSIVLGKKEPPKDATTVTEKSKEVEVCEICAQPISISSSEDRSHESSIAHQFCLEHSHPPSHLDRDHIGLKYLTEHGWDPDARLGLGARQEGIRVPVKAKEKKDTAGLGLNAVDEDDVVIKRRGVVKNLKEGKVVKLDAGQIRKLEVEKKKRAERLRRSFYGEDLSRYLGPDG